MFAALLVAIACPRALATPSQAAAEPTTVIGITDTGLWWDGKAVPNYVLLRDMLAEQAREHPGSDVWLDASKALDGSQSLRVRDLIAHYHLRLRTMNDGL